MGQREELGQGQTSGGRQGKKITRAAATRRPN
jgi:hypothetical protein